MRTSFLISSLLFLLTSSCAEQESAVVEVDQPETAYTTDTLSFTSGIRSIFQDRNGNYWLGSLNEGVAMYDGKHFRYLTAQDGFAEPRILSIQEDTRGNLWFETPTGVYSYDGEKLVGQGEHGPVDDVWKKAENDLWFSAGNREGVLRYDGDQVHYLNFPMQTNGTSGNIFAVTGISEGKENRVWFSTYAGVFGYDGRDFTYINDQTLGIVDPSERMHVRSILEDSQGRLWIGNNGIGVLLKIGNDITNFSKDQGQLLPMDDFQKNVQSQQFSKNTGLQSVFAIAEDAHGNIWFGDRDSGPWKYDGKTLTNHRIDQATNRQMIWTIYKDRDKNLLFGLSDGRVYQYNGTSFDRKF